MGLLYTPKPLRDGYSRFIQNEKDVEGKQITPDWYFKQSLVAEYLSIITEKINSSIALFDSCILSLAVHFDEENNSLLSTFTAQVGLEIIHKLNYRIREIESSLDDLDKVEVFKGEFKWIKPNYEKIIKLLFVYESKCYGIITNNIEKLSVVKWNNQFPDVFAHSYSLLSTRLNSCFANKDLPGFQKSFPSFLKASINAFGTINKTFEHFDKPQNVSYQTLLDLMEISGYGYIYSVLYENTHFWTIVKNAWDENFLPTKENIELFATYYEYYQRNLFGTGVNFNEKHQRGMTLNHVVQKMVVGPQDIEDLFVKPFIKDSFYSNNYNVAELFIEIYLFTFIEARDATKILRRRFFTQLCLNVEK
ncbi:hypothetical protein [Lewinella sp. LCG006]|uniref:hypothetical protein n=1 Tax=Lewinella sp. LCG006 TaxID=3231911 RepID=UPI0034611AAB